MSGLRTCACVLFTLSATLFVSGCSGARAIREATRVIDSSIADIRAESVSWRSELQQVARELPDEFGELIRADAQNLASRSVAVAGIEFRCNVDFLANRAIAALERLKAKISGRPVAVLPPAFCQVVPDAIDLNEDLASWRKVTFHGYDLDHKDSIGDLLKVVFRDSEGRLHELPEDVIGRTTHYQITVSLGEFAKQLHQDGVPKVLVSWQGTTTGFPEIVVVPWTADRKKVSVDLARTSFMPPKVGVGDSDFHTSDDRPMEIDARGELAIHENSIDSRVYLKAREPRHDWTTAEGWSAWARAYTADPGWKIVAVRPDTPSRHATRLTEHGMHDFSRPAGEVISRFRVWGDRRGDEAGNWTRLEAHWRPVAIELEETEPDWMR